MARRRKRSAIDRALFHMKPNRVAARALSGGRHQTFGAIVKSPFKSKTVHTAKSGRRAYQQHVARERKARAAEVAKRRKQTAADQRAARAQQRAQQPRAPRERQQQAPVVLSPITGKRITYREALASSRRAEREADRILAGKPARAPRTPKAPAAPKTPLQAAIDELKSKQPRKATAKPKPAAGKKRAPRKPAKGVRPLAPILAGTPASTVQRPGRSLSGVVMAASCACRGTGRIPVYVEGALAGTASCPTHGRKPRGAKKFTARGSLVEAGLPGIAGWLERKNRSGKRTPDRKQKRASDQAAKRGRHGGAASACGQCDAGIINRALTERLRADFVAGRLAEIEDEGRRERARKKAERQAESRYPHDLCSTCWGLGVVARAADGEWFETAGLKEGHRPTGRERATGKRPTDNAARVERSRKLPRI